MKMLFMDDDKDYLDFQTEVFGRSGYEVFPCGRTQDAETLVRSLGNRLDVAVLDMKMFEVDDAGVVIARTIRDVAPMVPSLVLTGFAGVLLDQASRALMEGICAYVGKLGGPGEAVGSVELALRSAHGYRIARLTAAIERSVARWWQQAAGTTLVRAVYAREDDNVSDMARYFRVMCAATNRWPMPNRTTPTVPLSEILPISGEVAGVVIETAEPSGGGSAIQVQSEVPSMPDLSNVVAYLSRNGFGRRVRCEYGLTLSGDRVIVRFTGDGNANGSLVNRINEIARGSALASEEETLLAIWVMQVSAFCGLVEMETVDGVQTLRITIPVAP
ncbi:MAG: hypothetical protein WCI03_14285 [bacterium]